MTVVTGMTNRRSDEHVRRLLLCVVVVLGLAAAACGNSDDDEPESGGTSTTQGGSDTSGSGDGEKVDITGVPGVTDDEIRFSAFGTNSQNPLGTCVLDCFVSGLNAYFAYRNSEGGIARARVGGDRRARRRALEEPAARPRDHQRERHLRGVQRHPGRERVGGHHRGGHAAVRLEHPSGRVGRRGRVRQRGRAVHRRARAASPRTSPGWPRPRRSASSGTASARTRSRPPGAGGTRSSSTRRDRQPRGRLLQR